MSVWIFMSVCLSNQGISRRNKYGNGISNFRDNQDNLYKC